MSEAEDDFPDLHPLIAFGTGIIDDLVTLDLEWATSRAQYDAGQGQTVDTVMTAAQAIMLGRALIERGELAAAAEAAEEG
ncbi:hypothetical protein [Brevundimonas sp. GCM10030266]|uniref:hypothetical protein n=1 Tax=Brevundimonas sp. GCM10030266 TaxID=3273386 RepID=UPI0036180CBF